MAYPEVLTKIKQNRVMKKKKLTAQKKTYAESEKEFIETLEAAMARFHKAQISWRRRNLVPITKTKYGPKSRGC